MRPVPTVSDVVAQIFLRSDANGPSYPFVRAKKTAVTSGLFELGFDRAAITAGLSNALGSPLVSSAYSGRELRAVTTKK